jgi:hypothetical protein
MPAPDKSSKIKVFKGWHAHCYSYMKGRDKKMKMEAIDRYSIGVLITAIFYFLIALAAR